MAELLVAADLLLKSIRDDHIHGDLLSRKTIALAIQLEQLLASRMESENNVPDRQGR